MLILMKNDVDDIIAEADHGEYHFHFASASHFIYISCMSEAFHIIVFMVSDLFSGKCSWTYPEHIQDMSGKLSEKIRRPLVEVYRPLINEGEGFSSPLPPSPGPLRRKTGQKLENYEP